MSNPVMRPAATSDCDLGWPHFGHFSRDRRADKTVLQRSELLIQTVAQYVVWRNSPCTFREPLRGKDQYGPEVHSDPATFGEISERLVHRLPRCADELCDLLLRQIMSEPQIFAFWNPETFGQLQ